MNKTNKQRKGKKSSAQNIYNKQKEREQCTGQKRQIGKKRSIYCAKHSSKTPSELGSEETVRKILM